MSIYSIQQHGKRKERADQVEELIQMVDDLIEVNHHSCYTSSVYQATETALDQHVKIKADLIFKQSNKEVSKLRQEVEVKRDTIESLTKGVKIVKSHVRKESVEFMQLSISNEEKIQEIQPESNKKVEEIRNTLRDDIEANKVSVYQEWIISELERVAGRRLQDIIKA